MMLEQTSLEQLYGEKLYSQFYHLTLPKIGLFELMKDEVKDRTGNEFGEKANLHLAGLTVDIGSEKNGKVELAWISFFNSGTQVSRYEIEKRIIRASYDNQTDTYIPRYRMVRVNPDGTRDLYDPLKQGGIPLLRALKHINFQNPI